MSNTIMLIPTEINVGLTSIILGIANLIKKNNIQLNIFKPIAQPNFIENKDKTIEILKYHYNIKIAVEPLSIKYAESLFISFRKDILMEEILTLYHKYTKTSEVILIEGLTLTPDYFFLQSLNQEIAKTLNAKIIFVSKSTSNIKMQNNLELIYNKFKGKYNKNIIGIIFNKINAPLDKNGQICNNIYKTSNISIRNKTTNSNKQELLTIKLPILAEIPWNFNLTISRTIDIARHLNAEIINEGEIKTRRVKSIVFCAQNISNIINNLHTSSLLVISADRTDILISVSLAIMNGVKIAAILLTGNYYISKSINKLYNKIFKTGIPVLKTNNNTWQTSLELQNFNIEIPLDDHERIKKIQRYISSYINKNWIKKLITKTEKTNSLSSSAFRYKITELARKTKKHIIFPEGEEPRIIKATSICAEREIATCILLGNPKKINYIATTQNIKLNTNIKIINPINIRKKYINRLIELRKNKGMTETIANKQIEDNVVLGTLMLEAGDVDGLVSGVAHTTANTIRPSLQLIKTTSNKLVSSIFFMLLPEQVYVYGDCAININPTAEELSEIAIQSADSAKIFGIDPFVAMISYSTGNSGAGNDVEKVRKATLLVQKKRPDIIIDGPLQYDAAAISEVAKSKAPKSPVAGKATVFIFPDLNTGNTTYKAVQRSANLISIGPMLQGMRKPVNDLSRGASVDDIIYTIALTAIQANTI
ncbi:Phosphate acetyltransferase [Candidatus Providencia siddallii]|uniref:Phosphate acetyltransferase n=1 Tax=Candidatus Providencia siddallii TaxID=1715285 RepID=A0A0M6WAA2_9GAMM|nr:Phosphate acetyltransferase [Candidatus Providencia siddallii]